MYLFNKENVCLQHDVQRPPLKIFTYYMNKYIEECDELR